MSKLTIGIISDTHGLLRPQAIDALRGCNLIIHGGDVGAPAIIKSLSGLAPTFAVRGNIDRGEWATALPESVVVEVGKLRFFVLHDIAELDRHLPMRGAVFAAVVFGHSHMPSIERREEMLFLNPGSAGPRRFKLPVTLARVRVSDGELSPEIVDLIV